MTEKCAQDSVRRINTNGKAGIGYKFLEITKGKSPFSFVGTWISQVNTLAPFKRQTRCPPAGRNGLMIEGGVKLTPISPSLLNGLEYLRLFPREKSLSKQIFRKIHKYSVYVTVAAYSFSGQFHNIYLVNFLISPVLVLNYL